MNVYTNLSIKAFKYGRRAIPGWNRLMNAFEIEWTVHKYSLTHLSQDRSLRWSPDIFAALDAMQMTFLHLDSRATQTTFQLYPTRNWMPNNTNLKHADSLHLRIFCSFFIRNRNHRSDTRSAWNLNRMHIKFNPCVGSKWKHPEISWLFRWFQLNLMAQHNKRWSMTFNETR